MYDDTKQQFTFFAINISNHNSISNLTIRYKNGQYYLLKSSSKWNLKLVEQINEALVFYNEMEIIEQELGIK